MYEKKLEKAQIKGLYPSNENIGLWNYKNKLLFTKPEKVRQNSIAIVEVTFSAVRLGSNIKSMNLSRHPSDISAFLTIDDVT